MLVGQEALATWPRYLQQGGAAGADAAAEAGGGSGGAAVRVRPEDCFHSFKRLMGRQ